MIHALRAFRYRNFRLYFCGQSLSLLGTWVQQVAMSWLVYRMTGSAFLLGVTAFASQIPILIFAPLGGLWADRFDRRKLLIATQALALAQALVLALLLNSAWNVGGVALKSWLQQGHRLVRFNRVMAVLLLGSLYPLLT